MTVVKWVSELESVDGISILGSDLFVDLLGGESVLFHIIIEFDFSNESHS